MKNNTRPKQLNLNPLSIAKFFYEKLGERGVEQPFLQPITYLAYQEILKKENLLIFKEEVEQLRKEIKQLKKELSEQNNKWNKLLAYASLISAITSLFSLLIA